MSVLDVANEVAAAVGVTQLTSLFTTSVQPRTQLELRALLNEMAQRIAYDTREWTELKKVCTFTGDGLTEGFDLPADYQRMLVSAQVYPVSNPNQPLTFISDTDEWVQRRLAGTIDHMGEWTLMGRQMLIYPTLVGQVKFVYMHKNCVRLFAGGYNNKFTVDQDEYFLGDRVLKLGVIWQWKANKGSPYAEDMGTYSDALMNLMGADKPAPIIVGRLPASKAVPVVIATVTE